MNVMHVPLPELAAGLKRAAAGGVHTGAEEELRGYVAACTLDVSLSAPLGRGVRLMYTRDLDEGVRSFHLSMSFRLYRANKPLEFNHRFARHAAPLFFGAELERVLVYPPQYPKGKEYKVWHFRLFADDEWRPAAPRATRDTHLAIPWQDYSRALFA